MTSARPLDEALFSTSSADGLRIHGSVCAACGARFHPPRAFCAACSSTEMAEVRAAPVGYVESFTVVHQPLADALIEPPYTLAEVRLDGGLRFRCVSLQLEGIAIGSRIRLETLEFETEEGPRLGLVFRVQDRETSDD